ncbi:MAG: AMIN domain-containing protein [Bdellovibrionales bacterium]|nr:AMIN domain-containing protein [Bdellovibrionales bacterium]
MDKKHIRYLLIFGNLVIISVAVFYLWQNTNIKEKIPFVSEFLSKEVEQKSVPVKKRSPETIAFESLEVRDKQGSALITMGRIYAGQYRLSPNSSSELVIRLPRTKKSLKNELPSNVHPLIQSVEVADSAKGDAVEVRIKHSEKVKILDKLAGPFLHLEISKQDQVASLAPSKPSPVIKPRTNSSSKPAPRPKTSATNKKVVKPSPPKKVEKKEVVTFENSEASDELLSIFEDESPELGGLGSVPVEEGLDGQAEQSSGFQDLGSLEETLLSDETDFGLPSLEDQDIPLLDAENQLSMTDPMNAENIAAIPRSDGKFDMDSISANLPAVKSLDVVNRGNKTQVSIEREGKILYKIFPKRLPPRLVVDFKNAKNGFKKEYKGQFPGTKVINAETKEYVGPNNTTMIRLILYLQDSNPEKFTARSEGSKLIIEESK